MAFPTTSVCTHTSSTHITKLKKKWTGFLGKESSLSLENKLLLYKVIIKPTWTYDIELWGCSSKSNVNIIQRFHSKTLRLIAGAPRNVSNQTLHADLSITKVEDERQKRADKHFQRLQEHENQLTINLLDVRNPKRIKRIWPCALRGE